MKNQINYGSGNLHSVHKSFETVNQSLGNPYEILVSSSANEISQSDKIVLPGVGAFGECKNALMSYDGLLTSLEDVVINKKIPFMGICVGMQLLADQSSEFEINEGLKWISGEVVKLEFNKNFPIPHMGWNEIEFIDHPLFTGCSQKSDFYFVHSYYFKVQNKDNLLATTKYPNELTAAVIKENIFGTQFHPEKSHSNGMKVIKNFLNWRP
ncbi:imidazole glycerol phosphate synthase subunit HisH [Pelagibacteraceae bacterium]|nr:imidazole glycerol phosphate synthase subunit HisH [Pelagibacteraceae bacterium]